MKKQLKTSFNLLRRVDAKIIALLSPDSAFDPRALQTTKKIESEWIKEFDKASFAIYFRDPRAVLPIKIYMRARNEIFIRIYRFAKKIMR